MEYQMRGWSGRAAALAGVLCGLSVALAQPSPASAHARLVQTTPAAGEVVGSGPLEVLIAFSEPVSPVPGKIKVIGPDGEPADGGEPARRGSVVAIPLRTTVSRGTYLVSYRVISADGHPIGGTFSYSVRERSTTPTSGDAVAGGDTDPLVRGMIPVAKYLGFAGLVLVVGAVLALTALWPRRLSRRGPARLAWLGVGLVGLSAVAGLVLQAPYTTGAPLAGITVAGVRDVLGTTVGAMYLVRLAVLSAVALLLRRLLAGRGGTAGRALLAVLGLVGLVTWPLAGHPAVSPVPLVTVFADVAHLAGMAVWLGGLVMLIGFLLRRAREHELVEILPTWSRWAVAAVCTLLVAGTANAVVEVGTTRALLTTAYGRLILAKVALIAVVLGVAYWSRRMVRAGTAARRPGRLRRLVGVELAVTAVVIAVAAMLVQTTPSRTASATPETVAVAATVYTTTLNDELFSLRVEIVPARAGNNTVRLYAYTAADGPRAVAEWKATAAPAGDGLEPIEIPLLRITENQAFGDFVLPQGGTWVFRFTARVSEIDQSTVTATVDIP
jgi:copper transport protein